MVAVCRPGCEHSCYCHHGATCNPVDGVCKCQPGFTGNRCRGYSGRVAEFDVIGLGIWKFVDNIFEVKSTFPNKYLAKAMFTFDPEH